MELGIKIIGAAYSLNTTRTMRCLGSGYSVLRKTVQWFNVDESILMLWN